MVNNETHLEPRVAKLEAGLEMLTRDVASLAQITRDQGGNIEKQIKDLAVGVTQAAAPRKTDWSILIALAMLIMAIGSAVFWPIHQQMVNLEEQLKIHVANNQREFQTHVADDAREADVIRTHYHEELEFQKQLLTAEIKGMSEKLELYTDKLYSRVISLEQSRLHDLDKDQEELRQWRNKAYGLTTSTSAVPLGSNQVSTSPSK